MSYICYCVNIKMINVHCPPTVSQYRVSFHVHGDAVMHVYAVVHQLGPIQSVCPDFLNCHILRLASANQCYQHAEREAPYYSFYGVEHDIVILFIKSVVKIRLDIIVGKLNICERSFVVRPVLIIYFTLHDDSNLFYPFIITVR